MNLQFLGATQTVTGSKYLLTIGDKKILIDCGLFQGLKELRLRNWAKLPLDPASINAVVLTHAHIDHSGYLPLLVKNGFAGKVFCTQGTKELCEILLPDSGYLQEEEANHANKYGYSKHKPALPLYTMEDAKTSLQNLAPCDFDRDYKIYDDVVIRFNPAGHIIGAATVLCKAKNTSVLFSGDLGRQHDAVMYPPEIVQQADYLVMESTYGDKLHEKEDPAEQLGEIINRTVRRGGTLIIPAFAVGRTQQILYFIYMLKKEGKIANIPVFLDSPMATSATEILVRHCKDHRLSPAECAAVDNVAKYVSSVEESKKIDVSAMPKIVISASGMATGGRVLYHIRTYAGDSRNTILFAGYQAAGTRGDTMLRGINEIKMWGEIIPVNAEVIALHNISAHADYEEILEWLRNFRTPPHQTFVTHGEINASKALREKIEEELHWKCKVPKYLESFELHA